MVLHALFSNSIGSIHDLEAYIKGDVIKHGNTLVGMLTTLEEVVHNYTILCTTIIDSSLGDQERRASGRGGHAQGRERGHDVRIANSESKCLLTI